MLAQKERIECLTEVFFVFLHILELKGQQNETNNVFKIIMIERKRLAIFHSFLIVNKSRIRLYFPSLSVAISPKSTDSTNDGKYHLIHKMPSYILKQSIM